MKERSAEAAGLWVGLRAFPAGPLEIPAPDGVVICLQIGPTLRLSCRIDGRRYRGLEVPGDVQIIPPHAESRWEADAASTGLVMHLSRELLATVASEQGRDGASLEVVPRFLGRDPQIELIGRALVAEIDAGLPSGPLFVDGLGHALAARIVGQHTSRPRSAPRSRGGLSGATLRRLLAHIDDHLEEPLTLEELAAVVGLSVSHLKTAFRTSTGLPVHRYVVRLRVERARALLRDGRMSTSEVAQAVGFADQSHLARHTRRVLGVAPSALRASRE